LKPFFDPSSGPGDFPGDEGFAPAGALVVKQDAVAGEHAVRFTVIDGLPEAVHLGTGIRAAGMERSGFLLGSFNNLAKHLAAGRLIEAGRKLCIANGFEQVDRAHGVGLH